MEAGEVGLYLFLTCVFASFIALPSFANPALRQYHDRTTCADGTGGWGDGACDCDQSVGQTIGRSLQSGTHLGFLSTKQDVVGGCGPLYRGAVRWRDCRSVCCPVCAAGDIWTPSNQVRGHRTRCSRQRRGFHRRTGDLFCSDVNHTRRVESRNPGALHTILRRSPVRDLHNHGSATFRNEHESCQKLRTSVACELLARNLALFHRANPGDAYRRRNIPARARRSSSLLRKTASRQQ